MIYFDKVSKIYPDESIALSEVTFTVMPKEFVSIVGHSGAGKTTMVKMILADEEIESDVPHVLELVGLSKKIWNFPKELSGGEKQRVAIARAIVNQPDIIIADEPTGNLDPLNTHEIVQILKKINDLGTTVILTTHNKGVIDSLGKRVVTMENGKIIRDDKNGRYVI